MKRGFWIPLLFVAALTGCGDYEWKPVEVGYRGEAKTNNLLLVERWAQAMGLEADTSRSWQTTPPAHATVIADADEWLTDPGELEDVLAWVDGGGHLIACVFGYQDHVHSFYDFEVDEFDDDTRSVASEARVLAQRLEAHALLAELGAELNRRRGRDNEVEVDGDLHDLFFPRVPSLDDTSEMAMRTLGDPDDANLLQYAYGDGQITLLASGAMLGNETFALGDYGHPEFLWDLLGERGQRNPLVLLQGKRANLWTLLVETFGLALLAGLALLLLWLWRSWFRFGPLLDEPPAEHRAFHEHVEATGRYLWRHREGDVLVHAYRRHVLRLAERRLPLLTTQDEDALVDQLVLQSGLSASRVRHALHDPVEAKAITRTIADLQHLRASL